MLTLWDLLKPIAKKPRRRPPPPAVAPTSAPALAPTTSTRRPARPARIAARSVTAHPPMQARYDRVTRDMLARYGVRVRKWRTSMSGIAWQLTYRDGTISRLIEAPRPRGPMSAAVFLHEIGHHAIGFNVYKPRCLEEYHAWAFALREMEACGLNVTDAVRARMHRSLSYAIEKARRRGLKQVPPELAPFDRPA